MSGHAVCLRFATQGRLDCAAYCARGGYEGLKKIFAEAMTPQSIMAMVDAVGLQGRGGAWFATARKWSQLRRDRSGMTYLVVNSDEGEPGTCKDMLILCNHPHQLLEGMIIAAYALGATVVYHYVRGDHAEAFASMEHARAEAYASGYIGHHIMGSSYSVEMYNLRGAGGYIVGEETALLESIEGRRPMPRHKPPFPGDCGLYGRPTVVHNTETIATLPVLLLEGPEYYAGLGMHGARGMKIFSISGHVRHPGVFELPLGTPFQDILQRAGGMRYGRALKAVAPGGTSMKIIPASRIHTASMDPIALHALGTGLGTGGIIVMDETTCMVKALQVMMRFYHHESCGQCTPCREGSAWIVAILERILRGDGRADDVTQLLAISAGIEGNTLCALGEAIAWPLVSIVQSFREEFDYFLQHGTSLMVYRYGHNGCVWGSGG